MGDVHAQRRLRLSVDRGSDRSAREKGRDPAEGRAGPRGAERKTPGDRLVGRRARPERRSVRRGEKSLMRGAALLAFLLLGAVQDDEVPALLDRLEARRKD